MKWYWIVLADSGLVQGGPYESEKARSEAVRQAATEHGFDAFTDIVFVDVEQNGTMNAFTMSLENVVYGMEADA